MSSLDAISAARRNVETLVARRPRADGADGVRRSARWGHLDLPRPPSSTAGRLIAVWEYDADAGSIAWATPSSERRTRA